MANQEQDQSETKDAKTKQIRSEVEVIDEFNKVAKALDMSQGEVFKLAVKTLKTDVFDGDPVAMSELSDLRVHIENIVNLFTTLSNSKRTAMQKARGEVRLQLESQLKTIEEQREKVKKAEESANKAVMAKEEAERIAAQVRESADKEISDYKNKADIILDDNKSLKSQLEAITVSSMAFETLKVSYQQLEEKLKEAERIKNEAVAKVVDTEKALAVSEQARLMAEQAAKQSKGDAEAAIKKARKDSEAALKKAHEDADTALKKAYDDAERIKSDAAKEINNLREALSSESKARAIAEHNSVDIDKLRSELATVQQALAVANFELDMIKNEK